MVYADQEMTCLVVRNLLRNTLKFTSVQGCISIYLTLISKAVILPWCILYPPSHCQ
jgi:signal transduction histidine kinase